MHIVKLTRVFVKQSGTNGKTGQMGCHMGAGSGYLEGNDVEPRALRTTGKSHLVTVVLFQYAAILEIADVRGAIGFACFQVPGDTTTGIVEIEFVELAG